MHNVTSMRHETGKELIDEVVMKHEQSPLHPSVVDHLRFCRPFSFPRDLIRKRIPRNSTHLHQYLNHEWPLSDCWKPMRLSLWFWTLGSTLTRLSHG